MSEEFDVNSEAAWTEVFEGKREETVTEVEAESVVTDTKDEGKSVEPETVQDTVQVTDKSEQVETKHKIKVGGEEIELPLSEIIKRAQMGEDYTRKTQAVSEERKSIEAEKARVQQILQEIEASKIQQPQVQQPVQQFIPETAQSDSEEVIFKAKYGTDFEFFDPEHQAKMRAIQRELAVKAAKDEIFKIVKQEQEQQTQVSLQRELNELSQLANTEPKEVIDFAIAAINSVAQTDPDRFITLYTANKKIMANQVNTLTTDEAKTVKEHVLNSRKAYYASLTKQEVREMKTESSSSPVVVDKRITAESIRTMDRTAAQAEFERIMKGG